MDTRRLEAAVRRFWDRAGDGTLAAVLFAASLSLYLQTLAPSVVTLFDDSLEFPLVAHRLAIAHPTGYPLYTLLAALLARGPGGNVAWSVNLLSAVAAALTVALVYGVARQLTRLRLPAFLGAAALAASPVFWSQAVIAEVYTLAAVFIAGVLWLALLWARQPLLPVKPFSLILAPPREPRSRLLTDKGITRRLPEGVREAGAWLQARYRRFFPAVPPSRRLQLHPLIYALVVLYGLGLTHGLMRHRVTVNGTVNTLGGKVNVFSILRALVVFHNDTIFSAVTSSTFRDKRIGAHGSASRIHTVPYGTHHIFRVQKTIGLDLVGVRGVYFTRTDGRF